MVQCSVTVKLCLSYNEAEKIQEWTSIQKTYLQTLDYNEDKEGTELTDTQLRVRQHMPYTWFNIWDECQVIWTDSAIFKTLKLGESNSLS